MSNSLAVQNLTSMASFIAPPPPELAASIKQSFAGMDDFGVGFRSIGLKGRQFRLRDGGSEEIWPSNNLPVVILGMARDNTCSYYSKGYNENEDKVPPDAIWHEKQGPPNIPAVPHDILQKRPDGKLKYKLYRRIVVAVVKMNPVTRGMYIDLENPYVLDVGSMSMFGDGIPQLNAYSLSGLSQWCSKHGIDVMCQFYTNLIFTDRSVPEIRFQIPTDKSTGQPLFIDTETIQAVYRAAGSPEVAKLVQVTTTADQIANGTLPPAAQQLGQQASQVNHNAPQSLGMEQVIPPSYQAPQTPQVVQEPQYQVMPSAPQVQVQQQPIQQVPGMVQPVQGAVLHQVQPQYEVIPPVQQMQQQVPGMVQPTPGAVVFQEPSVQPAMVQQPVESVPFINSVATATQDMSADLIQAAMAASANATAVLNQAQAPQYQVPPMQQPPVMQPQQMQQPVSPDQSLNAMLETVGAI